MVPTKTERIHNSTTVTGRKLIYIGLVESEDRRAQSTSDIALTLVRVVKEPDFQRNLTVRAEINALDHLAGGPVPDVQVSAVMTCTRMIYTRLAGVRAAA